jgi:hypothetical protein
VHIIPQGVEYRQDMPPGNYLLLLHNGAYPVLKKYTVLRKERIEDGKVQVVYRVKPQLYVRIGDVCHPVSSKASVLKLFPQNKAVLNAYAKAQRLNFRAGREPSILSLITYIETLP